MLEILGTIGFDWQVALANLVSFLIIFAILKKWVFGPIGEILQKRKETIQQGINRAQQSQQELSKAQVASDEILKEARKEANHIVAEAKQRGDEVITKATTKAQHEAEILTNKAHESIEKEKEMMQRDLFSKTAHLVSLGVQKILEEDITDDRDKDLVDRALIKLQENK